MNCAESQDLLLDLAYGELSPARAAEVEAHVQGCAACRAEKEQLQGARKAVAPLRHLEEPPAGFDEPILRAARAEAGLQSDGTPGPVVEVSATVKPLGLQAARLDPHAQMKGLKGRPAPRWGRRAAAAASIAAAAGLAVVVTSSLTRQRASQAPETVAPIQVRAPDAPVPSSLDDALASRKKAAAPEEGKGAVSPKVFAVPPSRAIASAPEPVAEGPRRKVASPPAKAKEQADRREQPAEPVGGLAKEEAYGFSQATKRDDQMARNQAVAPAAAPPHGLAAQAKPAAGPSAASSPDRAAEGKLVAAPKAAAQDPDRLENQAGEARRRGDYARAAALYQDASALRKESDPARAAWNLVHAVECLAAGGQVHEAIAARRELFRAFPGQAGQQAAADRALRAVQPAELAPADR